MDNLPFNLVDVAVIVALLISGVLAWTRGFVHEVLSVGAWIGAILATMYGFPYVQPYARQYIPHQLGADLAAGVVLFLVSLVVLSLVIRAVSKTVQASALNALDRSLGFLFGLLRGAFLVCLLYLGLVQVMPRAEQPAWLRDARVMPLVESGADILWALVPDQAKDAGAQARDRAQRQGEETLRQQSEKMIRDAISPRPKGGDGDGQEGYGAKARREMERAIERATEGTTK
ncbi:MAG: CvpA family protein [Hyphomicrobiales bacterium]|nr:CvpA family protein [Hyphomicrobiales bacterium]MCP5373835.1 CvpA family protein [Hyphomicrobiales bacterium]